MLTRSSVAQRGTSRLSNLAQCTASDANLRPADRPTASSAGDVSLFTAVAKDRAAALATAEMVAASCGSAALPDACYFAAYLLSRSLPLGARDDSVALLAFLLKYGIGRKRQLLSVAEHAMYKTEPRAAIVDTLVQAAVVAYAPRHLAERVASWASRTQALSDDTQGAIDRLLREPATGGAVVSSAASSSPAVEKPTPFHLDVVDRYLLYRLRFPHDDSRRAQRMRAHALSFLKRGVDLPTGSFTSLAADVVPTSELLTPRQRRALLLQRAVQACSNSVVWRNHNAWSDIYRDTLSADDRRVMVAHCAADIRGAELITDEMQQWACVEPALGSTLGWRQLRITLANSTAGTPSQPTAIRLAPAFDVLRALRFASNLPVGAAAALAVHVAKRKWSAKALDAVIDSQVSEGKTANYPRGFTVVLASLVHAQCVTTTSIRAAVGCVVAARVKHLADAASRGGYQALAGQSPDADVSAVRDALCLIDQHAFIALVGKPMPLNEPEQNGPSDIKHSKRRLGVGPSKAVLVRLGMDALRVSRYRVCDEYVTAVDFPLSWYRACSPERRRTAVLRCMISEGAAAAFFAYTPASKRNVLTDQLRRDFALVATSVGMRPNDASDEAWRNLASEAAALTTAAPWYVRTAGEQFSYLHDATWEASAEKAMVVDRTAGHIDDRALQNLIEGMQSGSDEEVAMRFVRWLVTTEAAANLLAAAAEAASMNHNFSETVTKRIRRLVKASFVSSHS
jgi:hypothetical protein